MNGDDWNQGYHLGRTGGVDSTSYGGQSDAGYAQGRKEWLASLEPTIYPPVVAPIVPLAAQHANQQASSNAFIASLKLTPAEWEKFAAATARSRRKRNLFGLIWIACILLVPAIGLFWYGYMDSHSPQSRSDQWLERQHTQRDQFNRDYPALAKKFAAMRNKGTQIHRNPDRQLKPRPAPAQSTPIP